MLKVTTSNETYYLVDEDRQLAKRFPAEGRGELLTDGDWFQFSYWSGAEIGKSMAFILGPLSMYDWQRTTPVKSIEEIDDDDC